MNEARQVPPGEAAPVSIVVNGDLHLYLGNAPAITQSLQRAEGVLEVLRQQGVSLMSAIDDVKADLDAVNADLGAIKTAVGSTIGAQQTQIADLQSQIAALNAGDALTASQLADLKTSADAVKVSADEALAAVQPAPTARKHN